MTLSPPRRTLASALTGTLGTAALAVVGVAATATPAAAADPAPVLTWEISQQFDDHLSTHTLTGGATETADGVITFPDGVGSYNAGNGTTSVQFHGQVVGAFNTSPVTTLYSVTVADPQV